MYEMKPVITQIWTMLCSILFYSAILYQNICTVLYCITHITNCICIHIYIYIYLYIYIYVCVCVYIYIYICVCVCVRLRVCAYTYI